MKEYIQLPNTEDEDLCERPDTLEKVHNNLQNNNDKDALEVNKMVFEIGKGPMNMMWDLFTHLAGPRLR